MIRVAPGPSRVMSGGTTGKFMALENQQQASFSVLGGIESLGASVLNFVVWIGRATHLVFGSIGAFLTGRRRCRKLVRALYELGARCVPIVAIVGLFTGLVLGLHGYYTLAQFGTQSMLGPAVSLSLVRELGPVLAAIMVVGQAGSALAGELGSQRKSEQIDALALMGIRPTGFLVGPKIIAGLIAFPILTAIFDLVGIAGGYLSGVVLMNVDGGIYWNGVLGAVELRDVTGGFIKSLAFAVVAIATAAFFGFHTHMLADARGTRGVNETTTRAVVWSCVLILAVDYVIASFLI